MVFVIGEIVVLVTLNAPIFPVPLLGKFMETSVFTQSKLAPEGVLSNIIAVFVFE